ncbi:hypothetical protein ACWDAZ_41375, partial [Streptomyces sp. NPDC001215]
MVLLACSFIAQSFVPLGPPSGFPRTHHGHRAGRRACVGVKALSGQTVTVAGVWSGSEQKNFQKVLDAFTE